MRLFAALAALCLLAACSSSGSGSLAPTRSGSGGGGSAVATHVATSTAKATCTKITASDVQPLVRAKITTHKEQPSGTNGDGQDCTWTAADSDFDPVAEGSGLTCDVTVGSDVQFPGSEKVTSGGSTHETEAQNTVLATALGTLCNRLFGHGTTTVDLSGL